jgi:hypothetical protein
MYIWTLVKKLAQYYQIFCDLSLDVVVGVLCNMVAVNHVFHLYMPFSWYAGLAAATWTVYLSDHYLDTFRKPSAYYSSRHFTVAQNKNAVQVLIGILVFFCGMLFWRYAETPLFWSGMLCVPFVLVYFLLTFYANTRFQWLFNKELLVAFVYTISVYAVVILRTDGSYNYLFPALLLFVVCYVNLLMLSVIEMKKDLATQKFSWALVLGRKRAHLLVYAVAVTGICIYITFLLTQDRSEITPLMHIYHLMIILHVMLYRIHAKLETDERYRKLSELIFWLPAVVLFTS